NGADVQGSANGVINGGVTFTPGISGQAFSFNGTDSFVALPDNFFPFPASGTGNAPFTFAAWFKTTQNGVIFGQNGGAAPFNQAAGNVPGLYVGTDGKLHSQLFWSGGLNQIVSAAAVNDGAFHHVSVTYDGTNEAVYLDGVQLGSHPLTQVAYQSSYHYQLGTGFTGGGWPNTNASWFTFNGLLDEPMVFNRPLSAPEPASIFTSGHAASP